MGVLAGYRILADDVPSWYRGVVAIFYQETPHFQVEAFQTHGLNVTIFQLTSIGRILFIVGCYLASDEASNIECVVAAIVQCLRGAARMVAGDFNSNLAAPEGNRRGEEIAVEIVTACLEDMSAHFLLNQKYWARDGRMW